jgi:hypothetical protein
MNNDLWIMVGYKNQQCFVRASNRKIQPLANPIQYYPYNLTIGWGTEKKEVKYRSNPSYGEAPLAFKNIENYLFALSEQARK